MNAPRLRGVAALVRDAVEHGSRAIERVQRDTARRTYGMLGRIPVVGGPARTVQMIHEAALSGVHVAIRVVNHVAGKALKVVLDSERRPPDEE